MNHDRNTIPPFASALGYSGVIPFAVAAAMVVFGSAGMRLTLAVVGCHLLVVTVI